MLYLNQLTETKQSGDIYASDKQINQLTEAKQSGDIYASDKLTHSTSITSTTFPML